MILTVVSRSRRYLTSTEGQGISTQRNKTWGVRMERHYFVWVKADKLCIFPRPKQSNLISVKQTSLVAKQDPVHGKRQAGKLRSGRWGGCGSNGIS